MTLEQMEAVATNLDGRVAALEALGGDAIAMPNNYYITAEGKTINSTGLTWLGQWDPLEAYPALSLIRYQQRNYVSLEEIQAPALPPIPDSSATALAAILGAKAQSSGVLNNKELIEEIITRQDLLTLTNVHAPVVGLERWKLYAVHLTVKGKIKGKLTGAYSHAQGFISAGYWGAAASGDGLHGVFETPELEPGWYLITVEHWSESLVEGELEAVPPWPFTLELENASLGLLGNIPPSADPRWELLSSVAGAAGPAGPEGPAGAGSKLGAPSAQAEVAAGAPQAAGAKDIIAMITFLAETVAEDVEATVKVGATTVGNWKGQGTGAAENKGTISVPVAKGTSWEWINVKHIRRCYASTTALS
jgi:hypothetical protein